ncbi:hypothetical protein EDB85DRAFT_1907980 [Lactarius pseudohatsudake]|nr:hypothetical protein EDB85DRAFT_1907980 [Lactarius pseudohatsudake]
MPSTCSRSTKITRSAARPLLSWFFVDFSVSVFRAVVACSVTVAETRMALEHSAHSECFLLHETCFSYKIPS